MVKWPRWSDKKLFTIKHDYNPPIPAWLTSADFLTRSGTSKAQASRATKAILQISECWAASAVEEAAEETSDVRSELNKKKRPAKDPNPQPRNTRRKVKK